jgi:hypothetical protein
MGREMMSMSRRRGSRDKAVGKEGMGKESMGKESMGKGKGLAHSTMALQSTQAATRPRLAS